MPTVLRVGPYRVYFNSHDTSEPPHVHVDSDALSARFWLRPVSMAKNVGFSPRELRTLDELIAVHQHSLLEAWHESFGGGGG
ncbi:MAG: DUF4160 domain-containing protein [Dehalococcoidia bacterium]|nr:DUF4160 domain-containing protein [Dehalococcoidia bacterium]